MAVESQHTTKDGGMDMEVCQMHACHGALPVRSSSPKLDSLYELAQAFRKMAKYALVRESTMTAEMSEETVDIVVGFCVMGCSSTPATCL